MRAHIARQPNDGHLRNARPNGGGRTLNGETRTGVGVSDYAGDDRGREAEAELGVDSIRGKSPIQGLRKPEGERDLCNSLR